MPLLHDGSDLASDRLGGPRPSGLLVKAQTSASLRPYALPVLWYWLGRRSSYRVATARRHPGDVLRAALAVALLGAAVLAVEGGTVSRSEVDAFRVLNDLPHVLYGPVLALLVVASPLVAGGIAVFGALFTRQPRLAGELVAGSALSYGLARVVKEVVLRAGPVAHQAVIGPVHHLSVPTALGSSNGFPSAPVAVVAALATCAAPYLRRPAARAVWAGVWLVSGGYLFVGVALPLDVVAGAALGWLVGALLNLAWGAPTGQPSLQQVRHALADAGMDLVSLVPAGMTDHDYAGFVATDSAGEELFVKVLGREERSADLLVRLWRFVAFRGIQDEVSLVSRQRQVEHEALLAMLAVQAGVRAPQVKLAAGGSQGEAFLVEARVVGRTLDQLSPEELDDKLLHRLWDQVAELHQAHIAHRDLRRDSILVDACGRPWLLNFRMADGSATPERLSRDVTALVVSLATIIGPKRAADSAWDALGPETMTEVLPLLQRLAMSGRTLRELGARSGVIAEVRARLIDHTGETAPPLEQVTRVRPRTLLAVAGGGAAVFVLLPQIGPFHQTVAAIQRAQWWWLLPALGAAAVTYVAAAVAQMGAVHARLRLWPMVDIQLSCSFANKVTPAGVGTLGLNERYIERSGVDRPAALAAVGVNALAGALVHAAGVAVAIAAAGRNGIGGVPLPRGWGVLIAVVVALGILGVVLATRLRRPLLAWLRGAWAELTRVLSSPRRAAQLFVGSAAVTLGNALALAAALRAFDTNVNVAKVIVVYLGGAAIASVSPTPGNLGAVEAALVAGLTGVGVPAGQAVAGVLAFRLVTFWLPTAPGFWAFQVAQRRSWL